MNKYLAAAIIVFLSVGTTPSDEEWTILLLNGEVYTDVRLNRLKGDSLVATVQNDTLLIPVAQISEIYSSFHPIGVPGWLAGCAIGGAVGAGVVVTSCESKSSEEEAIKPLAVIGCSAIGAATGSLAGCFVLPDEGTRYNLRSKSLLSKKATIIEILQRQNQPRD